MADERLGVREAILKTYVARKHHLAIIGQNSAPRQITDKRTPTSCQTLSRESREGHPQEGRKGEEGEGAHLFTFSPADCFFSLFFTLPRPTYCPWVSEDARGKEKEKKSACRHVSCTTGAFGCSIGFCLPLRACAPKPA